MVVVKRNSIFLFFCGNLFCCATCNQLKNSFQVNFLLSKIVQFLELASLLAIIIADAQFALTEIIGFREASLEGEMNLIGSR